MSRLIRFNPFSELRDPFADDLLKGFAMRPVYRMLEGEPLMRLDLLEDDKNFFVKAEIPGVDKNDIKVSVEANKSCSVPTSKKTEKPNKVQPSSAVSATTANSHAVSRSMKTWTSPAQWSSTKMACCN